MAANTYADRLKWVLTLLQKDDTDLVVDTFSTIGSTVVDGFRDAFIAVYGDATGTDEEEATTVIERLRNFVEQVWRQEEVEGSRRDYVPGDPWS